MLRLCATLLLANLMVFAQSAPNAARLTGRIWKQEGKGLPNGSIHIFLPDGTLLMTSCVETYRIAKWKADPKRADVFHVTEDGQLAYTAKILKLSKASLHLHKTLVRSKEQQEARLTAVESEFVCPDMKKDTK